MDVERSGLTDADTALRAGEPERCREICAQLLRLAPDNLAARFLSAVAALQMGEFETARDDLARVRQSQADNLQAAFYHAVALRRCGEYPQAAQAYRRAMADPGLRNDAQYELAICLNRSGQIEAAILEYTRLLDHCPEHADAAANLAALLESVNRIREAGEWADRALLLEERNTMAQLTRATLDRRLGKPDIARTRLVGLLQTSLSPLNRSLAFNQLGQCSDRLGDYLNAFRSYSESNRILQQQHPEAVPSPQGSYSLQSIDRLRQWLASHPPSTWSPTPEYTRIVPVFLLGFPRSGTTLLDRALSAHPAIEVLEEAELLDGVRKLFVDGGQLKRLHTLSEEEIETARDSTLRARQALIPGSGSQQVVDKLPLNSVYIQLIHRLFPEAKIIVALRDPRDVCLSCWFQSFDLVGAMPYFLTLTSTAQYYDAVMSLLSEALDVLPLTTHYIRYEHLVTDFETQMKGLLGFLGLPWDEGVLDYRSNTHGQRINTPSYQQVTEPLHTRSIERWRHYAPHLGDAFAPLSRWVEKLEYPLE
jgi:tetratricopeptide (TPR) repeat protein